MSAIQEPKNTIILNEVSLEILNKAGITIQKTPRELPPLGEDKILYDGALHYIYAPSGVGKSYISAFIASRTGKKVLYFDLETNPKGFHNYCDKLDDVTITGATDEMTLISSLTNHKFDFKDYVLIFDSFSMFMDDAAANNNATDTSRIVKAIHKLSIDQNTTIIVIDHATELVSTDDTILNFKIEGNKSGKKKPVEVMFKLSPMRIGDPLSGGILKVEKSRVDGLRIGQEFYINSYKRTIDAKGVKVEPPK